jgi:hypothetical protein
VLAALAPRAGGCASALDDSTPPSNASAQAIRLSVMIQSMADEHMSNGEAAAWPTTGMIFSVAEVSRHGSAATAQPPRGSSAAPSVNHATTRMKR